jgi:hypothetical protein
MKPTVNETCGVSGVEVGGEVAQTRQEVVESGWPEFSQRRIQCHAIRLGCNRKRPGVIESRVERFAFLVHVIKRPCYHQQVMTKRSEGGPLTALASV